MAGGAKESIHVVKVPDIGEGIAEVEVVAWHVQPGERVEADAVVADVMTDKATVEVPVALAGEVISLGCAAGEKLAVGAELLRLAVAGASAPAAEAAPSAPEPVAAPRTAAPIPAATPVPAVEAPPPPAMRSAGKSLASPSVRRQARELGIDVARVRGSGPEGRVLHEDLMRHASGAARAGGGAARYAVRDGVETVQVIGLRRQIALRMQESARRIPHFTYVEEIDVTELEALRARLNAEREAARGRLTVLPFIVRAIVLAVPGFPQVNALFDDEKGVIARQAAVHVGIATQTANGLMVPVVRHAEARDPWDCAAEIARLAEAARAGKATRGELTGSTITITSLGPLGGIASTPIINRPEVAIVGVNRIVERPAIRSGAVVPRKLMNLSSSFDHRVVDGEDAARFVQALRGYLECPALLFVD